METKPNTNTTTEKKINPTENIGIELKIENKEQQIEIEKKKKKILEQIEKEEEQKKKLEEEEKIIKIEEDTTLKELNYLLLKEVPQKWNSIIQELKKIIEILAPSNPSNEKKKDFLQTNQNQTPFKKENTQTTQNNNTTTQQSVNEKIENVLNKNDTQQQQMQQGKKIFDVNFKILKVLKGFIQFTGYYLVNGVSFYKKFKKKKF
jgi:hypothetical protein